MPQMAKVVKFHILFLDKVPIYEQILDPDNRIKISLIDENAALQFIRALINFNTYAFPRRNN